MLDFLPIPNLDRETLARLGVFALAAVVLTVLLFFGIRAIVYRVRNRERLQYEKLYGKGNYPEDILHDVGGCIQYYKTDADETYWFEVHLPKPGSGGARKLTNRCPSSYIHIPHFLIRTLNPYKAYLLVDQLEEYLQSTGHGDESSANIDSVPEWGKASKKGGKKRKADAPRKSTVASASSRQHKETFAASKHSELCIMTSLYSVFRRMPEDRWSSPLRVFARQAFTERYTVDRIDSELYIIQEPETYSRRYLRG